MIRPSLLALLASALLALAYRVPGFWPVSFVALVPLMFAVTRAKSTRAAFLYGFIPGLTTAAVGTSWFFASLPLPASFGVGNPLDGLIFVGLSWLLVVLSLSPWKGVWAAAIRAFDFGKPFDIAAASVLFVAAEYLQMLSFNWLTFAAGVGNPPFFSAGFLGYPLADDSAYLQLAAFGGVYALSLLVVLANLAFFALLRVGNRRAAAGLAIALMVIALLPVASWRSTLAPPAKSSITVGLMTLRSPIRPEGETPEEQADALAAVRSAAAGGASLILVPEDSRLFTPFSDRSVLDVLGNTDAAVIDSGSAASPSGGLMLAATENRLGHVSLVRTKIALTPQGEYLPSLFALFLTATGNRTAADAFSSAHDYRNGSLGSAITLRGATVSVMFCSETLMPGIARELVAAQGSDLLLNPASHAWFSSSPSLEADVLRFVKVETVEAGVPSVRSANDGPAYALDAYGRELARIPAEQAPGSSVVSIPLR